MTVPGGNAVRGRLVGYGLPVAAACAATQTWFSPGRFVASGDVPPYLRTSLTAELGELWNHQVTGAGSASHAITQALDVMLLRLAALAGAPPAYAQRLLFAACLGLAAFGAAYLVGAVVRRPVARAAAGLLGAFNAYVMVTLPNVLPAIAIGLTGLLAGMVLRAARGARVPPALFALASLPASYLAQNAALLLVAAAMVVAVALAAGLVLPDGTRRASRLLCRAAPAALLVNLWWLVPYAYVVASGDGLRFTAETDVAAWQWTQVRSSVANVLALNTHWGWGLPEYFPYAGRLDGDGWRLLRWLPALLAATGLVLLLADRRPRARRAAALAVAALGALVVLSTGVRAPFGALNSWLFAHVPGAWLLREPMSKLGVALVLCYAFLCAVAVERVARRSGAAAGAVRLLGPDRRIRRVATGAVTAAVALAAAYPWPLWTGAVIPATEGMLPPGRVAVPAAWHRVATDLDAGLDRMANGPPPGKVVVLPLNVYYQTRTSWGYHGVDAVPAQLLRRPVLQRYPGGYFAGSAGSEALLTRVQSALLAGSVGEVSGLLRALGASHVILRLDLSSSPHAPQFADPGALRRALDRTPGLDLVGRYPVAQVYHYGGGRRVRTAGRAVMIHDDRHALPRAVGAAPADQVVVADPGVPLPETQVRVAGPAGARMVEVGRPGTYLIERVHNGTAPYLAVRDGHAVAFRDLRAVAVAGRRLPPRPTVWLAGAGRDAVAVAVDGRIAPLSTEGVPVTLRRGSSIVTYRPDPAGRIRLGRFTPAGTCGLDRAQTAERPGLRPVGTVGLASATCAYADVPGAVRPAYRLRFSFRASGGAPPEICLWQVGPNRCADLPAWSPGASRWAERTAVASVSPGTRAVRVFLYGGDRAAGRVWYRDVTVEPLRRTAAGTVVPRPALPVRLSLPAGRHRIEVTPARPSTGGVRPDLADCPAPPGRPAARWVTGRRPGEVDLTARAGVGCVLSDLGPPVPGAEYRVTLRYRTYSGRPARVCLWQIGPDRCADLPGLDRAGGWHRMSALVRPDPATRGLRLYLYVDGQQSPASRVAYRDVRVEVDTATTVRIRDVRPAARPPTVAATGDGGRYRVEVAGASGSFVLALAESYSPRWRLDGLPGGWRARHVEVDGYANAWLVRGSGDAVLTIAYRPAGWAYAATVISLVVFGALSLLVARRAWRRRLVWRAVRSARTVLSAGAALPGRGWAWGRGVRFGRTAEPGASGLPRAAGAASGGPASGRLPPGTGIIIAGGTLIAAGLAALILAANMLWGSTDDVAATQRTLGDKFERLEQATLGPTPRRARPEPATPTAPPAGKPPLPGYPVARMDIPRLGERWLVVEGVAERHIKGAPGHYQGTAMPGEVGNFAVAGHRAKGLFWDLDKLRRGDHIVLRARRWWFVYRVTGTRIVKPTAVSVIAPVPGRPGQSPTKARLTLTTCEPKLGTSKRLVVHADLVRVQPAAAGSPPELTR